MARACLHGMTQQGESVLCCSMCNSPVMDCRKGRYVLCPEASAWYRRISTMIVWTAIRAIRGFCSNAPEQSAEVTHSLHQMGAWWCIFHLRPPCLQVTLDPSNAVPMHLLGGSSFLLAPRKANMCQPPVLMGVVTRDESDQFLYVSMPHGRICPLALRYHLGYPSSYVCRPVRVLKIWIACAVHMSPPADGYCPVHRSEGTDGCHSECAVQ